MTAAAIISGELTTMKHIPTRKVYQLIVEIPAEAAAAAFAALGTPGAVDQIPVAVARLVEQPAAEEKRERTPFTELPYAQQAAMRCAEIGFRSFIRSRGYACSDETAAAGFVRLHCGVKSRADIHKGTTAGDRWEGLEGEYFAHTRGMR